MREIVLDTETTGLKVEDGHRVIEIGAIEMINHVQTGKVFSKRINPEREIDKEASLIHKIKNDDLIGEPVFSEICDEFLFFLSDSKLIIHNASFDLSFLNNELKISGYNKKIDNEFIDTIRLAKTKGIIATSNLQSLIGYYERNAEFFYFRREQREQRHGALLDAMALAEVYIQLIGGKQTSLIFNEQTTDTLDGTTVFQNYNKEETKTTVGRSFNPSKDEKEKHKEFIETLKNPIWKKYL